jgi:hypothetical protein
VLPLNRHPGELGVLLDAAYMQRVLTEIQAFMFREAEIAQAPALGRTALAAFGSGNTLVRQLLSSPRNQRHPFYLDTLRELYMFDAPTSEISTWISQAMLWAQSANSSDKMVRVYSRVTHESYAGLLGTATPNGGPFVVDSPSNTLRTVAVLPDGTWRKAATDASGSVKTAGEAHQLVAATMLTDALRRSGFEGASPAPANNAM